MSHGFLSHGCRLLAITVPISTLTPAVVNADVLVCNGTIDEMPVAIGIGHGSDSTTKGWWNIQPDNCAKVVAGPLSENFFVRAQQPGKEPYPAPHVGGTVRCVTNEAFELRGDQVRFNSGARDPDDHWECIQPGYTPKGFFQANRSGRITIGAPVRLRARRTGLNSYTLENLTDCDIWNPRIEARPPERDNLAGFISRVAGKLGWEYEYGQDFFRKNTSITLQQSDFSNSAGQRMGDDYMVESFHIRGTSCGRRVDEGVLPQGPS